MANQLNLTLADGSGVYPVDEANIIFIETDTLGSKVTYIKEFGGNINFKICSDSPSTLAGVSESFFSITGEDTKTYYINFNRVKSTVTNSTGVSVYYDAEGQHNKLIQTTDSASTFFENLYTKEGQTVYSYDAVNSTNNTVSLAAVHGDKTSTFAVGVYFTIFGSSTAALNGASRVLSSVFSVGKTVITLNSAVNSVPTGASQTGKVYI